MVQDAMMSYRARDTLLLWLFCNATLLKAEIGQQYVLYASKTVTQASRSPED